MINVESIVSKFQFTLKMYEIFFNMLFKLKNFLGYWIWYQNVDKFKIAESSCWIWKLKMFELLFNIICLSLPSNIQLSISFVCSYSLAFFLDCNPQRAQQLLFVEWETCDTKSTIFTATAQRAQIWKSSRPFGQSTMVRSGNFRCAYLANRKRCVPPTSPFALVRFIVLCESATRFEVSVRVWWTI